MPASGKKQIVIASNANLDWDEQSRAVIESLLKRCAAGAVLTLDWEAPSDVVEWVIELAVAANVRVVGDPSPVSRVEHRFLRHLFALSANHSEAGQLAGLEVENVAQGKMAAETLRNCGTALVCVRLPDGGVVVGQQDEYHFIPPWPVDPVDTTGAGDAFTAALAIGTARGWSGLQSAALGCAAASIATTASGAQVDDLTQHRLCEIADRLYDRSERI